MAPRRTALGRELGFGHRAYVYLTSDAVEVDEVDGWDVTRSRVLLDDVMLLTLHRRSPWGLFLAGVLVMAIFLALAALLPPDARAGTMLGLLPPLGLLLLVVGARLVFGVHYVSVFGRRSRARMAFSARRSRARAVFTLLEERVRERQRTARAPLAEPGPG